MENLEVCEAERVWNHLKKYINIGSEKIRHGKF